jgi:hypothetical protein
MRSRYESARSTHGQRQQEVATILARGLLRLQARAALAAAPALRPAAEKPPKSSQDCLES